MAIASVDSMKTPQKGRSHKKKKKMRSTLNTLSSSLELSPKKLNMNASSSKSFVTEDEVEVAALECMDRLEKKKKGGHKKIGKKK